jgi:hypothetical protein
MALTTITPSRTRTLLSIFFILCALVATYEMRISTTLTGLGDKIQAEVDSATYLRTEYTGIPAVDYGLRYLVVSFLPGAAGWNKGFQVQMFYFLVQFFGIIGVYSVEAGRRANVDKWIHSTTIWALFYQTVGGAIIIPLYCLAYLRDSGKNEYFSPASRRIPLPYAKALLPAMLIGYLIPTLAIFYPLSLYTTQGLVALWQPTPLYINILTFVFSKFFSSEGNDTYYLRKLYILFMLVSALSHIAVLYSVTTSNLTLTNIFIPRPGMKRSDIATELHHIFQIDFWIIFAASLAWAYGHVCDMKALGFPVSRLRGVLTILFWTCVAGPAAAVAAVWLWREDLWAKAEAKEKHGK